jgi:hypothetical protein
MMIKRRRFQQSAPLNKRLTVWAKDLMAQALALPPGRERDELVKKARQAEVAAHLDDWANSPGLQPPRYGRQA